MASSDRFVRAAAAFVLAASVFGARPAFADPPTSAAIELPSEDVVAELAAHELTILVWWSATCPCVERYTERIRELSQHWPERDVAIILVASNADETPTQVRESAAEAGLDALLVLDEGGQLARHYGVRSTPTVVLVDPTGEAMFTGWIDNERLPGARGREPYLVDAVDAALAGESARAVSPTYGCAIARDARRGCCTSQPD